MNKFEFIRAVTDTLKANDLRKPVSIPKQTYYISDDEGNARSFSVKKKDKNILFTIEDVKAIVNACIEVIEDCLKRGEPISFSNFGTLGLKYRKPRQVKPFNSEDKVEIEGRFIPKFSFGKDLRLCAKLYEMSLKDRINNVNIEDEDDDTYDAYDDTDGAELNGDVTEGAELTGDSGGGSGDE